MVYFIVTLCDRRFRLFGMLWRAIFCFSLTALHQVALSRMNCSTISGSVSVAGAGSAQAFT